MRLLASAMLYLGLSVGANADTSAIADLRAGDMRKLAVHAAPLRGSDVVFVDADDVEFTLAEHEGKYIVLNFWATWCAPCRHEMPMLSQLQAELGGDDFQVVTVATGRNPVPAMKGFFEEIGVDNLPLYRDPRQKLARDMGVLGLPVTMILDPEGQEVARLQGDADWSSDDAKLILNAFIESGS